MRYVDAWSAFLAVLFMLVGLCGLFASYASAIPLERGLARSALLDEALDADAAGLQAMRPELGTLAGPVIDGPGTLPQRVAQARRIVDDERRREAASIDHRTRLMLGVITVLAMGLGVGIMALARRAADGVAPSATPPTP